MKDVIKRSIAITVILTLFMTLMAAFVTDETFAASKTHLKKTSITLIRGETYQQKLILPSGKAVNASKVKWSSNYKYAATISSKGKITAKNAGTVNMTAKYKGKTYKFKVVVKWIGFDYSQFSVEVGSFKVISLYQRTPTKKIPSSSINFWSEDEDIAVVSSRGVVTGISAGTTEIYAEYKNNIYSYKLIVKEKAENPGSNPTPSVPKSPSVTIKGISAPFSYSYDGEAVKVLDVKVSIRHLWDDNYDIIVSASMEALTDISKYGYLSVPFRIYDSEGFIVKEGVGIDITAPRMSAGAKAKDECSVQVKGKDNYMVEFYPQKSSFSGITGYFF